MIFNKNKMFNYVSEKLKDGAHLSNIVLSSLSIDSITAWHDFFLEPDKDNSNIKHNVGEQIAENMVKEVRNLKNWIIVLEESMARCNDSGLIKNPPPQDSYFCYSDNIFTERIYYYILPKTLQENKLFSKIIAYSLNSWQNVGYVLEKQDEALYARKFFCDNNDLDSVLYVSMQNIALPDGDFVLKIKNILESYLMKE
jgi:hypothetical protein